MNVQNIIESGLLELYCLGVVSEQEKDLIEQFASEHPVIKDEIASIENSLNKYVEGNIKPAPHIKQNIFDSIYAEEAKENGLPFILSPDSKINDWFEYLKCNQIEKPEGNDALYMTEFSKTNNIVTYIAWGKPGAFVEEEHCDELERLFMLQGSCKIDFDGVT
ncbi:MAG: hypothetical protein H7Y00_11825, partial [Fimbriimonadaceae bacterium]|nr:hypothetical protein [Chitinophagales bacterium]